MPAKAPSAPQLPGWIAKPSLPNHKWEVVKDFRLRSDPCPDALSVNAWVNSHVTYTPDAIDIWQAPSWTFEHKTGDCEDFAILKRAILLARGWKESRLALLILDDPQLCGQHAVLWVAGEFWDNVTDAPIDPAALVAMATPMFAFGAGNWAYGRKT